MAQVSSVKDWCFRYSRETFAYCIISELAQHSFENNTGVSSIESAVYAFRWGHEMACIEACPASHPFVKFALEGTKRRLVCPVQPEEPLTVSIVQAIALHFASSASLFRSWFFLLFFFALLVGFAGFFFALTRLGM